MFGLEADATGMSLSLVCRSEEGGGYYGVYLHPVELSHTRSVYISFPITGTLPPDVAEPIWLLYGISAGFQQATYTMKLQPSKLV